ncbi:glucose dehydrogenase [FAD, quinone]-like [Ischnura elegans]|uniref:glucose dehydrogenase [FAD, quinone]-like n=1 Tax=Ischnura elegans TaxID=197161 RepID=UPI001ED8BDCA|nr:glucose dehydrogenase [FAD, quinone]-like [Ischnura elegans]
MDPLPCTQPSGEAAVLFMASIVALSELQREIGDNSIYPADATIGTEYDFIIAVAGLPGSALANRLSINPDWKILLLEEGADPPFTSQIPSLSATLVNSSIDYGYLSTGDRDYCLGMVDRKCKFPKGKVLGGSSTLNTPTYWRGNPRDYNRWARANQGWSYDDLLPFFEKSEGVSDAARADEEEAYLSVEPFDGGDFPLMTALRQAAGERGHLIPPTPQKICQRGFYDTFGLLSSGEKSSGAKAYLPPLKEKPNVDLVRNAVPKKINFNANKKIESVIIEIDGVPTTVNVKKELILSAGSTADPKILMLSGIGPRKHLTDLSIPVVADLPVGRHMQDHVLFPGVVATINRGDSPDDLVIRDIRDVAAYLLDRTGALSGIGYRKFTGFINSRRSRDTRSTDIQILFDVFMQGDTQRLLQFTKLYNYNAEVRAEYSALVSQSDLLIISPAIMYPRSEGYMELASSDPTDPPTIVPNFFDDTKDEEKMLSGIADAMRILKTSALKEAARVEPRALLRSCITGAGTRGIPGANGDIDDSDVMTKSYWRCAMRTLSAPQNFVGTCRMGPRRRNSVVDRRLRVYDVDGLRIADSSIMPSITTGDVTGAVAMIAEKAANMILSDWSR